MVITPGIPEYLTGSSKLDSIIYDPVFFFIGLFLNIALYTTGALLIREFSIKFNKGWFSTLLLGVAYGIMEEGVAVHTFLLTSGNPVGSLGTYGRYAGIDWMWALFISSFHSIFSIGLPLLLLSTAYAKYSRESLLGRNAKLAVSFIFLIDVIAANLFVAGISGRPVPTAGEYAVMLALVTILIFAAYSAPGHWLSNKGTPGQGVIKLYLLGLMVFPLYLIYAYLPSLHSFADRVPPILEALAYIFQSLLIARIIAHCMPKVNNRRHKFALALGLITPLLIWAEIMQLIGASALITIVAIIAIVLLFKLRKWVRAGKYQEGNISYTD